MILTLAAVAAGGYAVLRTVEALGKKVLAWLKGEEQKVAGEAKKLEGEVAAKL